MYLLHKRERERGEIEGERVIKRGKEVAGL